MRRSQSLPKKRIREDNRVIPPRQRQVDDLFENFRTDIENMMSPFIGSIWDTRFPRVDFPG